MIFYRMFVIAIVSVFIVSCSHNMGTRQQLAGRGISREDLKKDRREQGSSRVIYGMASYYGEEFHGRKTANGEIFDMNQLTAAHRTLPFETLCRVTNLENNRSVIVRINDRGPFVKNRVMDLSRAAALKLDGLKSGVFPVKIEIIKLPVKEK